MSLILDALRKIEQERRTRRQGSVDLRADVLNYHGKTAPSPKNLLVPLLGLALFVIIAAALFFFLKTGPPSVPDEKPVSVKRVDRPAVQPGTIPADLPPPASQRPQPPKAADSPVHAPQTATPLQSGDGAMVISGIAWQEERGQRRAVVNGVLAGEGADILGARIVEIREDRVIFTRDGRNFEVQYPGGAGR